MFYLPEDAGQGQTLVTRVGPQEIDSGESGPRESHGESKLLLQRKQDKLGWQPPVAAAHTPQTLPEQQ